MKKCLATLVLFIMFFTIGFVACDDDDDDAADDDAVDDDTVDDDAVDDDVSDDDVVDDDVTDDDVVDDDVTDDDAVDDDIADDDVVDDDIIDDDTGDDDTTGVECEFNGEPYLQHVTKTSMRILWKTMPVGSTKVEYGPTEELGEELVVPGLRKQHEVEITGLEPETTYYYRVYSCGYYSDKFTFTTAVETDSPFTFAVYGDNRTVPARHAQVVQQMIAVAPDIVLNVGDIVTDGWILPQYANEFFEPAAELMRTTPLYVSIGNHEDQSAFYFGSFSFPGGNIHYSFTYGNTFFIGFDSNRPYGPLMPQYKWLKKQLESAAAQEAEFIVVYCHHPPYCEGWDTYQGNIYMRYTIQPLFENYGVDVWFAGHTHDYERGHLNGMTYYVTGGGGAGLDHQARDFEHIVVYESRHHFVYAQVAGNIMTLDAIDIDGNLFDTYELAH